MMEMSAWVRVFNTVRHLKFIQVWNRVVRRSLPCGESRGATDAIPCAQMPQFTFLNHTATPEGWNDATLPKLWLYNLHYFDWLNGDVGCEQEKATSLIKRWIDENPVGWGNGWDPYPISLRVVNWIKFLKRKEHEAIEGEDVVSSIEEQMEWLLPRLEYHLLANHLLANAKALVYAGKFLGRMDWYGKGLEVYRKELPEQVLDDGVHFELSPMYHCIILEDMLDCWEYTGGKLFEEYASKMVAGLDLITGPDGMISLFGDSAYGIAKTPTVLRERFFTFGGKLPERLDGSRTSGFVRLQKGEWTLIAKCGDIGPGYQPGHAHADTGSFELWCGEQKVISDTGTDRYVVDDERKRQRGTAAHNCVMVDDKNSSEVWAGHRVARRARPLGWRVDDKGASVRLEYVDCSGFRVCRHLRLSGEGLAGEDEINGRGIHDIMLGFHLMPEADAEIEIGTPLREEPCKLCVEFGRQIDGIVKTVREKKELPYRMKWSIKRK